MPRMRRLPIRKCLAAQRLPEASWSGRHFTYLPQTTEFDFRSLTGAKQRNYTEWTGRRIMSFRHRYFCLGGSFGE